MKDTIPGRRVHPPALHPSGGGTPPSHLGASPAGLAETPPSAESSAPPAPAEAPAEAPAGAGWTWAQARDAVWTVLGVLGLLYVVWSLLRLLSYGLIVFGLAAVLAIVIRPLVEGMQRRSGLPMGAAALLAYVFFVGLAGVLGGWALTQLGTQLTAFAQALPASYAAVQERIPVLEANARSLGLSVDVEAMRAGLLARSPAQRTDWRRRAWPGPPPRRRRYHRLPGPRPLVLPRGGRGAPRRRIGGHRPDALETVPALRREDLLRMVRRHLLGQLTVGAIVGSCVFALCTLSGVRYGLVLAVLAFFSELVPLLGPIITGSSIALAGLVDSFWLAVVGTCLYYLLRTSVVYVLGPRIVQRSIGLHPIATILGLAVAVRLFGVWGLLLTSPVLGFASVLVAAIYRQARGLEPHSALVPPRFSLPRFR